MICRSDLELIVRVVVPEDDYRGDRGRYLAAVARQRQRRATYLR